MTSFSTAEPEARSRKLDRFQNCGPQLSHGPSDLLGRNDGWWRDEDVVSGESVDAALHGVEEKSFFGGGHGDASGEIGVDPVERGVEAKFWSAAKGRLVFLSATNSTPQSRPIPRTSPTESRSFNFVNSVFKAEAGVPAPSELAACTRSSRCKRARTARPAAKEIG